MNNENTNETEIKLSEIFYLLLNKLWIIISVAILFGLLAFSYIQLFITPLYTTSASIYVDRESSDSSSASNGLTITTNIAKDYPYIIKSDKVLGQVVKNLGLNTTSDALSKLVNISFPETNTRVMVISVSYRHPQIAANIANNIVEVASEVLPQYSAYTQIKIVPIDPAGVPSSPSSPHTFRNTLISAFIGAVLAALVIIIIYLLNDKLKSVDDVEKYLGLSVLGVIPHQSNKHEYKYREHKYAEGYSSEK